MELCKSVFKINSREDLANFISELKIDLNQNNSEWENPSLERFLEAMQGFVVNLDGWEKNCNIDTTKMTSWQLVGHLLLAAKMYE